MKQRCRDRKLMEQNPSITYMKLYIYVYIVTITIIIGHRCHWGA